MDAIQNHRHYIKDGPIDTIENSNDGKIPHTNSSQYSPEKDGYDLMYEVGSISPSLSARTAEETRSRNLSVLILVEV
jgi:hypothetical protein